MGVVVKSQLNLFGSVAETLVIKKPAPITEQKPEPVNKTAVFMNNFRKIMSKEEIAALVTERTKRIAEAFYTCPRCGTNTGKCLSFNPCAGSWRVCSDCRDALLAEPVKETPVTEEIGVSKAHAEKISVRLKLLELIHGIDKRFLNGTRHISGFLKDNGMDFVDVETFKALFDEPERLKTLMSEYKNAVGC